MRILKIAFGHPDNVLTLTREMSRQMDVTLVFVVSGDRFTEGILDQDLQSLHYGLNTDVAHNLRILPQSIRKYLGEDFRLYFLRTYDRKILKDRRLRNFTCIRRAIRELKKNRYDVVHFNGTSGFLLYFVPLFRKYPKVWTLHDYKAHSGERNFQAWVINKFVARFKFHFIQHYRFLREQLIHQYHLPAEKVHAIYSGSLDLVSVFPEEPVSGIPRDFILFFGRISRYKGVDDLLMAYDQLGINGNHPALVVAGGGSFWFDTSVFQRNPSIFLLNRYVKTTELVWLIRRCRYVVTPYKDATHSAVIATAYAFNKPVIATDVDGLSEVVQHEQTGMLVKPNDPGELVHVMKDMNHDIQKLDTFSNNIMELRKNGKLAWHHVIRDYESVYQKALTH